MERGLIFASPFLMFLIYEVMNWQIVASCLNMFLQKCADL